MRLLVVAALASVVLAVALTPAPARADQATDKARGHYETGLELFYAREHAQALIEFQRAHEVKPRPATLFMMGQCEYLLGSLRSARDHYEEYLRESPTGEFVEVAKDRIEAINRRPATLVINTVPDQVDVRITPASPIAPVPIAPLPPAARGGTGSAAPSTFTGQAPNNFAVPRGRWVIAVSKANFLPQEVTVEVEVADTKPLFFKLEPIPPRLEIETVPRGATLYVNGNLSQNPYRQDVTPGHFNIVGEATDYERRTEEFVLAPGDRHLLVGPKAFHLRYVQRSGRPELIFASAVLGGLVGAGAVAGTAAAAQEVGGSVSVVSLTLGGALAGIVGGALIGNSVAPSYIPDNRALFVIGGMWVGAAEGVLTGMTIRQGQVIYAPDPNPNLQDLGAYRRPAPLSSKLRAGFLGSLPGLAVGITAGAVFMNRAPTYGRVALIQSAAVGGAVVGGLTAVALRWNPFGWQKVVVNRNAEGDPDPKGLSHLEGSAFYSIMDLSLPALIGLNVGLAGGLMGAYLSDQSRYGPSWKRIALIDLAAGAGALAAGVGACVADNQGCLSYTPDPSAQARTAAAALLGGGVGLVAGILLTGNMDRQVSAPDSLPPPALTLLPLPNPRGGTTPMLSAIGFF